MDKAQCSKCKAVWIKRLDDPKQCPRCHNTNTQKYPIITLADNSTPVTPAPNQQAKGVSLKLHRPDLDA